MGVFVNASSDNMHFNEVVGWQQTLKLLRVQSQYIYIATDL